MIRRNLFWKLLSLAVAIILWAYVNAERNPRSTRTFVTAIQVVNLGKEFAYDLDAAREATVSIRGPAPIVDSLRKDDVKVWIDADGLGAPGRPVEANKTLRVRIAGVAQEDLELKVSPVRVRVRIEEIRTRRLPVETKLLSPPPIGYSYGEPRIIPPSVTISGRASAVSRVSRALVTPVPDPGSRKIDQDVEVRPVDAKGAVVPGVQLDNERVRVEMNLVETPATKMVLVSPRVVGQPRHPAEVKRIIVSPPTVTIEGKPAVLMELSTVFTDPIDIDGIQATVTRSAEINAPAGVRLLGARRVEVTVQVASP